jgi:hypothetical protein
MVIAHPSHIPGAEKKTAHGEDPKDVVGRAGERSEVAWSDIMDK